MSAALASLPNFFTACRTASILVGFAWPALLPFTLFFPLGPSRGGQHSTSSTLSTPHRLSKGGRPSPGRRGGPGAAPPTPAAGQTAFGKNEVRVPRTENR